MADTPSKGARLIKNSVLNVLNSMVTMGVTFVTSIVVARLLKPEKYGIFNLVLWVTGIATWAIGMGLIHAVTKYVAEYTGRRQKEELSAIVVFVLRIELVLSLVCTSILILFRAQIADYFFTPKEGLFFFIAFIGLVPGILTAVFSAAIEGLQKFEYFTYFHLIVTPLAFAAKLVVLYMGYRIDGLLWVTLVFSFINAFFFYWILKREGLSLNLLRNPLNPEIRGKLWRYNLSVGAIQIADKVVWDKSENFFLGRFCSAVQIGYYNLAFNVAQRFMSVLPSTFWRVLFPAMSEYFGSGDQHKIKRLFYLSSRYLAFFAFPVGVGGIVLAWPMLYYLYGHDYTGAKYALQIIFFSSIFGSLANPGSAILYGTERQGFILRYGLFLAVVNIAVNIVLIPRFGALGAAFSYAFITIAGSVGGLIYTCRVMDLTYPFKSISKIILSTAMMGAAMTMVVNRQAELLGFILAVPVGVCVYFLSSLVMGSFEEEDYILMNSVKVILPEKIKPLFDGLMSFMISFKDSDRKGGV